MTFAGSWGDKPRTRYTRSVQPGQTGGMNAQGSVSHPKPPRWFGPSDTTPSGTKITYGNSGGQGVVGKPSSAKPSQGAAPGFAQPVIKHPSYADARYYRNAADLVGQYDQQRAETLRNISQARQQFDRGERTLQKDYTQGVDQASGQLAAQGLGRSGVTAATKRGLGQSYQENYDELLRQFGPKQRQFMKDMLKLQADQLKTQMESEGALAAERESQYQLAGQTPPSFTPEAPLPYLKAPKDKKGKK